MKISVNELLDIGIMLNGKFPEVYWDMGLSGSEIKVLRYVYNNCLRLYSEVKIFPRGKDNSPRFWRGKEKMAEDCGLSCPTFRKSVRHLHELGLVTSMDQTEDDPDEEQLYCIGLSTEFISYAHTENNFCSPLLIYDLIEYLYDKFTLNLLKNNNNLVSKFPLDTKVSKPSHIDKESYVQPVESTQATMLQRTPIYVQRTPIHLFPEKLRLQSAKQKLKLLQNVRTSKDKHLFRICEYYEFKCRQVLHSTGFRALGKNFREHKNWKYLEKLNTICETNNWDYKIYIDSQFDRVKYWTRKQVYPFLNQMISQNAQNYYLKYIKDYEESNSLIGNIKVKSEKIKSVEQQIIDEVVQDCESIQTYIDREKKRRINKDLSLEQLKILYLSDHWMGLSVSYLSCIPWFLSYLEQFPSESFVQELQRDITTVQKSKKLYNTTLDIVSLVESQMNIPKTMCM